MTDEQQHHDAKRRELERNHEARVDMAAGDLNTELLDALNKAHAAGYRQGFETCRMGKHIGDDAYCEEMAKQRDDAVRSMRECEARMRAAEAERDALRALVWEFIDFDHDVIHGTEIGGDAGAFIRAWRLCVRRARNMLAALQVTK